MATDSVGKRRANNWTESEITSLIDIWREPSIAEKLKSKARNGKGECWRIIGERLKDLGYQEERSNQQIHNKIKDLRRNFKLIHDQVGRSGAGTDLINQFPFYYALFEILGNRPSVCAPDGSVGESSGSTGALLTPTPENQVRDIHQTTTCPRPNSRPALYSVPMLHSPSDDGSRCRGRILGLEDWYEDESSSSPDRALAENTDNTENESYAVNTENDLTYDEEDFNDDLPTESDKSVEEPADNNECAVKPATANIGDPVGAFTPRRAKKRERPSAKDRTVDALSKKMKEVTSSLHNRFMATEDRRRKENLEQRAEDRKSIDSLVEVMRLQMEEKRKERAERQRQMEEERLASDRRFQMLLAAMTSMQNVNHPGYSNAGPHGPFQPY